MVQWEGKRWKAQGGYAHIWTFRSVSITFIRDCILFIVWGAHMEVIWMGGS